MLDMAGIVLSSVMILLVIVRAVRRDRAEPWFQTVKQVRAANGNGNLGGWRRK